MRSTNIRQLKHATSTVPGWVAAGETVQVKRRNQVIAVLSPPPARKKKIVRPDFAERLNEMWGDRVLESAWTDVITEERGGR